MSNTFLFVFIRLAEIVAGSFSKSLYRLEPTTFIKSIIIQTNQIDW